MMGCFENRNLMGLIGASLVLVFVLGAIPSAQSATEQGNRGPIYLGTAWNLEKGDVNFHANSRFYFNNKTFYVPNNPAMAVTFWDIQGGVNLLYGIGKHYQIGLTQIIYQDNHKDGKGYNFPDDLFLKMKIASFPIKQSPFNVGLNILTRIPVAEHHNIRLEPYSAGQVEFGVIGLLSYAADRVNPEDGFNVHVNLGLIDHNDHGVKLGGADCAEYQISRSSREVNAGVALVMPTSNFDFLVEMYGNYNITKPPPNAYSRHSYVYITPEVIYKPFQWITLGIGFDFRLTPNRSSNSDLIQSEMSSVLPTYPTWRVNFGVKMSLAARAKERLLAKDRNKPSGLDGEKKKDVYKGMAEERKEIENAEAELEKIRSERQKMDEILKRLRKALEIKEDTEKKKDDKK
ncbi:MAG: DUF4200 domain-containing protein [candidate division KSB1 bacterium]|nr:DUF4200 domain-containing protein [candidate division KSB1 bacterium]